jgi:hypothetical protein
LRRFEQETKTLAALDPYDGRVKVLDGLNPAPTRRL